MELNGIRFREIENDLESKKIYVKLVNKEGVSEELELKEGTTGELIDLKMEGKDFVKAKFFNKKHVLLDDIELTIPCNEGSYIYFGKRIIMFDYYRQRNLPFPIGQYDEKLEREITFDDLIGRSYIEFDDGSIETNVEPGSITFDEIQRMICGEEKKLEYRRSL